MRRTALLAPVLLAACSAGTPAPPAAAPLDVGHGSVEEVRTALAARGLPCENPKPIKLLAFEEAGDCTIGGVKVRFVHFFSAQQATEYEAFRRGKGEPGVYAATWAAQVPTSELAGRIAAAIAGTSYS